MLKNLFLNHNLHICHCFVMILITFWEKNSSYIRYIACLLTVIGYYVPHTLNTTCVTEAKKA